MDIMWMTRPVLLACVGVAMGVATLSAVLMWRSGRARQRETQSLNTMIEELRAENERLVRAASSISHELMQPLGTITNYAEMIRLRSTEEVSGYATSIIEVSAKAARRIRECDAPSERGNRPAGSRAAHPPEQTPVLAPAREPEGVGTRLPLHSVTADGHEPESVVRLRRKG